MKINNGILTENVLQCHWREVMQVKQGCEELYHLEMLYNRMYILCTMVKLKQVALKNMFCFAQTVKTWRRKKRKTGQIIRTTLLKEDIENIIFLYIKHTKCKLYTRYSDVKQLCQSYIK